MSKSKSVGVVPAIYNKVFRIAIALGCTFNLATGALAQDAAATSSAPRAVEEIIVTATRRNESVQDIPMSISALSQGQLEDAGVLQAKDVARIVPGFDYTEVNSGQAVLAIRGVLTSSVFGNVQQPVALYHDDVPVLDLTIPWTVPRLQLFDAERVEVLRGPQGTLFGAGALSGAVRVISNEPNSAEYEGAVGATVTTLKGGGVGNNIDLMLNAPLVDDQLAIRAVGYFNSSPGWIDNTALMDNEVNDGESYGGRVALKWEPTENFELTGSFAQTVNEPNDSAYVGYDSGSDTSDFRIPTFNTDDSKIYSLNMVYFMPWATLTSSTSRLTRDATSSMDFSGFANLLTGLSTISPLIDEFETSNFLQEIRLASSGDGRLEWVVGIFYEDYDFDLHETIVQEGVSDIPLDFVSGPTFPTDHLENTRIRTKIEDYAVFGEASYQFSSSMKLTVGARYSDYSIDVRQDAALTGTTLFEGPPNVEERSASNDAWTPKMSLKYQPNEDLMVYALAAKGFRTGNSNLAGPLDPFTGLPIPQAYDPDSLWSYEAGLKVSLLDSRLTINAAVFYIDWEKVQLQVRTESGLPYTDNAGAATSKGIEVSLVNHFDNGLELGTTLGYTDATLDSVEPGVPDAQVGDRLPGSAKFTGYVYGQYRFAVSDSIGAFVRLDYSYSGLAYSELGNKDNSAALSYGKNSELGARMTFDSGPYELGLFAQNLTNNRDRVSARDYFFTAQEIRQKPRTVGVHFRVNW